MYHKPVEVYLWYMYSVPNAAVGH